MFFIDLARLGMTLLLLTIATVKAKPEQCCSKKIVGSISYTLLPDTVHGQLPNQCLNNCIYTYTEQPKFCFAKGIAIFKRMSLNCILLCTSPKEHCICIVLYCICVLLSPSGDLVVELVSYIPPHPSNI